MTTTFRLAVFAFAVSLAMCPLHAKAVEVWFAPNDDLPRGPNRDLYLGRDFQHLFDPSPTWSARTDVFGISPMMVSVVGPKEELQRINAFALQHHIALAAGAGLALVDHPDRTPGECGFGVEGMGRPGRNGGAFKRLKELGVQIKYISMDEPLTFAHYYNKKNACRYSIQDTARRVAAGLAEIRQYYPDVRVVDSEAPTITSAAQWNADFGVWLQAYRQAVGTPLDAVVFDIDWRMPWKNWVVPGVSLAHKNGVRAGIYLDGTGPGAFDADAVAAYKRNMQTVDSAHLPFDLVIVANWTPHPSRNLPESDPNTLTSVLAYYNARHGR